MSKEKAPPATRVYLVGDRAVEATSNVAAILHVYKPKVSVMTALQMMQYKGKVEVANPIQTNVEDK